MNYLKLDEGSAAYFAGLDPFMMLEKYNGGSDFAVGAFLKKDEAKELTGQAYDYGDVPAGLLVFSLMDKKLVLRWIFVDADFRNMGIGEFFMNLVFAIAVYRKDDKVFCYTRESFGREMVCPFEEGYLESNGFVAYDGEGSDKNLRVKLLSADVIRRFKPDQGKELQDEDMDLLIERLFSNGEKMLQWEESGSIADHGPREVRPTDVVITLKDLEKGMFLTALRKDVSPSGATFMANLPLPIIDETIRKCLEKHPCVYELELRGQDPGYFAADLSCLAEERGSFTGIFLLHRDDIGRLWLMYLFDTGLNSVRNVAGMLKLTLERALRDYAPDTQIVIPCDNKIVAAMAATYLK